MSFVWFMLGFTFGALVAPTVLFWWFDRSAEVEPKRSCPPCDGNCRQGRDCPAGKVPPRIECTRCGKFIDRS